MGNTGNSDKEWEAFGRSDPYFGVVSHEKFKAVASDTEARSEFFALGEKHVEHFFSIIKEYLDPNFAPRRALDFGCGVGRLTIPIARRVNEVVGLDVSRSMLDESKLNCDRHKVENVMLVKSDDGLTRLTGSFDFLHSFIVFQHIPVQRGEAILAQMLGHLADGGVGALHFTYASLMPGWKRMLRKARATIPFLHNFVNLAQGQPFGTPHMQMNMYDVNRLLLLLQRHDCHRVHVRFSNHGACLGAVLFFKKHALQML